MAAAIKLISQSLRHTGRRRQRQREGREGNQLWSGTVLWRRRGCELGGRCAAMTRGGGGLLLSQVSGLGTEEEGERGAHEREKERGRLSRSFFTSLGF